MKSRFLPLTFAVLLLNTASGQAGSLDTSFDPGSGADNVIWHTTTQPDGKIILTGAFLNYNGIARSGIARLNLDGSVDTSFDPGSGANDYVQSSLVQSDGKIIIVGAFTSYNGTALNRIARLNPDGSLDPSFDPGSGANGDLFSIAIQPDGNILIGGIFSVFNGITCPDIVRLHPDGSVDTSFNTGSSNLPWGFSILVLPDGKIFIGGKHGTPRKGIVRLNADGSVDSSFDPGPEGHSVFCIAVQADGKILLAGSFASLMGMTRNYIARLNADGSLDASFDPGTGPNSFVEDIEPQPNGKIIIGGDFTTYSGIARNHIALINVDGSLNADFDPGTGTDLRIYSNSLQPDGKIILAGDFTSYNGTARNHIARILGVTDDCLGVPDGPALPGTACDDGNANSLNDVYGMDCTCLGVVPPANLTCANAVIHTLHPSETIYITGDNTGATDEDALGEGHTWEVFTLTACASSVTLSLCGTLPVHNHFSNKLYVGCPHTNYLTSPGGGTTACVDGNFSIQFDNLQAGTYYYPMFAGGSSFGPYTLTVTSGPPCIPAGGCDAAIAVTNFPVESQALVCGPDRLNATTVPSTCGSFVYNDGADALYTFVPTMDTSYRVSLSRATPGYTSISVYADACPQGYGTCKGSVSSFGNIYLDVQMTAGTTYYLWFDSYYLYTQSPCPGAFSLDFTPAPPANDDPCTAIPLTVGSTCNYASYSNALASASTSVPNPGCGNYIGGDVWYSFIVPIDGAATVDLDSVSGGFTNYGMAWYTGSCGGQMTLLECDDDDSPNGNMPMIARTGVMPGDTVWVRIWTSNTTAGGSFGMCLTGTTPLPNDCLGVPGGTATIGSACDDGDANTGGDVYGSDCVCAGQLIDCLGVPGGTATIGTACDDGNAATENDTWNSSCVCSGTLVGTCTGNQVVVLITTDANPGQITWEITDASNATIATGGPSAAEANQLVSETACLGTAPASACYGFRLTDSFGDGITGGGWELRSTTGKLLLRDEFNAGSASPSASPLSSGYGTGHSFCLPLGPANIAASECGIFTNAMGNKVYADPVVGAAHYQFEFTDPDAGFIRRIAAPRRYVHFSDMVTYPLVPGVKYFVRVRTDVAGPIASSHFGAGCEVGMSIPATVPCSHLIEAPAYGHSCNETRAFGRYGFIYAQPVAGADYYQFHIYNTAEEYDTIITRNTYILQLKWAGNPMVNGSTYNVEINVGVNGLESGFCASSCTITIVNPANLTAQQRVEVLTGGSDATLWPNPVREGQVNLQLTGLYSGSPSRLREEAMASTTDGPAATTVQHITVDVQDIYGKQVFSREFANRGERFSTILQLPGDIASGVYLVNITVNGNRTVQRLSIIQ